MGEQRLERARAVLQERDLDAALITSGINRRYLSGFTADDHAPDELSAVVLISRDTAILLAPPTNLPWAASEAVPGVDVRESGRPWTGTVAEIITQSGWHSVGIEDETTSVAVYNRLHDALNGDVSLAPVGTAFDHLRASKDAAEVERLEQALRLTDEAFVAAERLISLGMTEHAAAEIIREELRACGSEGEAFPTIVASGPNAAKPHHSPGDRVIQEGEPIIIDMGALFEGYCGDLTRTIWFGQPSGQLVTIYETVAAAHGMALAKAAPGVTGRELDDSVRAFFAARDLDLYFVHSLGHGLGLRVHEAPSASPASGDTLTVGHVVTIEPGLYIPDWGGVRIEDVVLIEPKGARNLTGAPKGSV
jgi:Xaa-Pro aminopeptidase